MISTYPDGRFTAETDTERKPSYPERVRVPSHFGKFIEDESPYYPARGSKYITTSQGTSKRSVSYRAKVLWSTSSRGHISRSTRRYYSKQLSSSSLYEVKGAASYSHMNPAKTPMCNPWEHPSRDLGLMKCGWVEAVQNLVVRIWGTSFPLKQDQIVNRASTTCNRFQYLSVPRDPVRERQIEERLKITARPQVVSKLVVSRVSRRRIWATKATRAYGYPGWTLEVCGGGPLMSPPRLTPHWEGVRRGRVANGLPPWVGTTSTPTMDRGAQSKRRPYGLPTNGVGGGTGFGVPRVWYQITGPGGASPPLGASGLALWVGTAGPTCRRGGGGLGKGGGLVGRGYRTARGCQGGVVQGVDIQVHVHMVSVSAVRHRRR
ncbi:hypothetical protein G9A89_000227 [Geosiphon pyriformis]|nr:hypothetical protein G9A89_000227 [Geosiphon pyriformis]